MSFGSELRQERESRGISLSHIAEATKVSERHLRALESDTYAELPGGIFNRGIVRSACVCIGLNPETWTARFAAQHADETAERDWRSFAENVKASRSPAGVSDARWLGVAAMVLAVLALSWAAWHYVLHPRLAHRRAAPATPVVAADAVATDIVVADVLVVDRRPTRFSFDICAAS